ncbi:MAG: thermonuclease family protein [Gammaproteobacteria bacterium]|nr:thermonuclease family protein [Gammaproteobacteria bacterium]MDH5654010.1 thermonuclease family protein [Gammaproteobacteria bacterium]
MSSLTSAKKASQHDAFFYARLLLIAIGVAGGNTALQAASDCHSGQFDETVSVAKVQDGDTLHLADGRKLRIIGVNTPELAREDRPAELWATEARAALRGLLGSQQIKLRWGEKKHDRYGRMLAHVYLPDGLNVSEWLLRRGHGLTLTIPPNIRHWSCYLAAEQEARTHQRGLWSLPQFQPLAAGQVTETKAGYRLLRGTVGRIGQSRASVWLNLEGKTAIRIKRSDLGYFNGVDFKALQGRQILARGWFSEYKNQLVMQIKHPAALEVDGKPLQTK